MATLGDDEAHGHISLIFLRLLGEGAGGGG